MWLTGANNKRFICFTLEVLTVAFIFSYPWSLEAPNNESTPSFEAAPAQHLVFRNTSSSGEFPFELISKANFAVTPQHDLSLVIRSFEISTSDCFEVSTSLRNPFYAYTTINAP
jgi:hypothetical protein